MSLCPNYIKVCLAPNPSPRSFSNYGFLILRFPIAFAFAIHTITTVSCYFCVFHVCMCVEQSCMCHVSSIIFVHIFSSTSVLLTWLPFMGIPWTVRYIHLVCMLPASGCPLSFHFGGNLLQICWWALCVSSIMWLYVLHQSFWFCTFYHCGCLSHILLLSHTSMVQHFLPALLQLTI